MADFVVANDLADRFVEFVELDEQPRPCVEHGFGNALEHRLAGDQLVDAGFKLFARDVTDLEAEATQNSADAQLNVLQLVLQQFAGDQQCTDFL